MWHHVTHWGDLYLGAASLTDKVTLGIDYDQVSH